MAPTARRRAFATTHRDASPQWHSQATHSRRPVARIATTTLRFPTRKETRYRIDASRELVTVGYFDGTGKQIQKRVQRAPGDVVVSGWRDLNPWSQIAREADPTLSTTMAFSRSVDSTTSFRSMHYDAEGRTVRTVSQRGGVSTARYGTFEIEIRDANDNDGSPENVARGQFDTARIEHMDVLNRRLRIVEAAGTTVEAHDSFRERPERRAPGNV